MSLKTLAMCCKQDQAKPKDLQLIFKNQLKQRYTYTNSIASQTQVNQVLEIFRTMGNKSLIQQISYAETQQIHFKLCITYRGRIKSGK